MKYLSSVFLFFVILSCSYINKNSNSEGLNSKIMFYSDHIKQGWKFAEEKDFKAAAAKYTDAFIEYPTHVQTSDIVDAAYYWMLAGEIDSAFFQLKTILADTNYTVIKITDLTKDRRFFFLQKYPQWKTLIAGMKRNRNRRFPNINSELDDQLDDILYKDQFYRGRMDDMQKKYSPESGKFQKFYKKAQFQDSINLKNVISIIDKYGWLGPEEVGFDGNTTLFLVIQHSDSATQSKYLPLLRKAVADGEASGSDLALLEDRVALGQGKRQIYGSQIAYDAITRQAIVLPLEDPERVDQRRASVGLQSMSSYLMHWKLTWDAKKYKQNLAYDELKMKIIEKMRDSINLSKGKLN